MIARIPSFFLVSVNFNTVVGNLYKQLLQVARTYDLLSAFYPGKRAEGGPINHCGCTESKSGTVCPFGHEFNHSLSSYYMLVADPGTVGK